MNEGKQQHLRRTISYEKAMDYGSSPTEGSTHKRRKVPYFYEIRIHYLLPEQMSVSAGLDSKYPTMPVDTLVKGFTAMIKDWTDVRNTMQGRIHGRPMHPSFRVYPSPYPSKDPQNNAVAGQK